MHVCPSVASASRKLAFAVERCWRQRDLFGISDRRNHGFGCFAGRAIISAQIKTNLVRFDSGQYQGAAAPRTRRAEVIDEFEIERIDHGAEQRLLGPNS